MFILILLSILLIIIVLWIIGSTTSIRNTKESATRSSPTQTTGVRKTSGWEARFAPILGSEEEPSPIVTEEPTEARYLINYIKRIYINRVIPLKVSIGSREKIDEKVKQLLEQVTAPTVVQGQEPLNFTHSYEKPKEGQPVPKPLLQVELKFAESDFTANTTKIIKEYDGGTISDYLFPIRPLKSEELPLAVEFSYVGVTWLPARETGYDVTTDSQGNVESKRTTYAAQEIPELIVPLATEHLKIDAKSFLNMNASTLNVVSKALAAIVSLIYVLIVTGNQLTEDPLGTWIAGITSILGIIGIPVAADVWGKLVIKKPKDTEETG